MSYMLRNLFLFASLVFFACSNDSHGDLLDGTDYGVSEKEDCDGTEYNPKTQFCSSGIVKDKGEFTDGRDGKKYKYVEIGSQIWMAENLNYEIADTRCYDNNVTNCEKCGRLYNWLTATTKDICPEGWRLPNNDDRNALEKTVGGNTTERLSTKSGWKCNHCIQLNRTDDFGFSALACGVALYSGVYHFNNLGYAGYFWSATEYTNDWAYYYSPGSIYFDGDKRNLYSVRCIKN